MGKAAKFKQIRRISRQLPVLFTTQTIGTKVMGKELPEHITEVAGKPVVYDAVYRFKESKEKILNHNRKMKEIYNKRGVGAVNAYIAAVNKFAKSRQKGEEDRK